MTEMTPIGTVSRLTPGARDWPMPSAPAGSAPSRGSPVPGVELRVVDDDGREVPWDGKTMGELVVRGPWVAAAYYNDERSADSFTADGWFRTGDVATIDAEGYVQIADRTKDLIKSGGEWISIGRARKRAHGATPRCWRRR